MTQRPSCHLRSRKVSEKKQDELLSSEYDGIKEYDNMLPRWWVYLFYITIVFAPVYTWYYHFGPGLLGENELAADMQLLEQQKLAFKQANGPKVRNEEDLLALVADKAIITKGQQVYVAKCAACHGQKGEGLVGPNLTDKYWIHGGKLTQIRTTIEEGVLAKGMLAWKALLPSEDIESVVAFIRSLKDTAPANAKAPQGDLVEG